MYRPQVQFAVATISNASPPPDRPDRRGLAMRRFRRESAPTPAGAFASVARTGDPTALFVTRLGAGWALGPATQGQRTDKLSLASESSQITPGRLLPLSADGGMAGPVGFLTARRRAVVAAPALPDLGRLLRQLGPADRAAVPIAMPGGVAQGGDGRYELGTVVRHFVTLPSVQLIRQLREQRGSLAAELRQARPPA